MSIKILSEYELWNLNREPVTGKLLESVKENLEVFVAPEALLS
jgi:hypothetical protein